MKKTGWKVILSPLSMLYGLILAIRHDLYDTHLLPSHEVDVPTICVGNLAVGGTGKTPHIEYLIRLLSTRYKVAVLSRGYGRRSHGFCLADERSSARTLGDELMQMHRKFPTVPMAACKNRVEGIRRLKRLYPQIDVVLLDDAFQYRALKCGFNILLTTADNLYVDDHLLPWGTRRDLLTRAQHATAIIITKCSPSMRPIDKRVLDNKLHLPTFQKLFFSHIVYKPLTITAQHPLLITGIAHPSYLLDYLRASYPNIELLSYRDHHRFTRFDVARIRELAQSHDIIFTTEKDYERLLLTELPNELGDKLHVVPMSVDLDVEQPELERLVMNYVSESLRSH